MKTTKIKLKDGWWVGRHTGNFDTSMEWYSLFHHHDGREFEVDWSEPEDICCICKKSAPDDIVGFLNLCRWKI